MKLKLNSPLELQVSDSTLCWELFHVPLRLVIPRSPFTSPKSHPLLHPSTLAERVEVLSKQPDAFKLFNISQSTISKFYTQGIMRKIKTRHTNNGDSTLRSFIECHWPHQFDQLKVNRWLDASISRVNTLNTQIKTQIGFEIQNYFDIGYFHG